MSTTRENDDQTTTTSSEKVITPLDTPLPVVEPLPMLSARTPETVDTRVTGMYCFEMLGVGGKCVCQYCG